jgi:stage II sporulation protein D
MRGFLTLTILLLYIPLLYSDELDFEIPTHYFHAIRFSPQNIPIVSILITNQHNSYYVSSSDHLTLEYRDKGKISSIKTRSAIIERGEFKAGSVIYKLIVDRINYNDTETRENIIKKFKELGYEVESVLVGAVFGLKGKVYDNRQFYISIATFKTPEEAEPLITDVFNRYRIRAFLLPVLKSYPSGKILVYIPDRQQKISVENVFWVRQNRGPVALQDGQRVIDYGSFNGDFYFTFEADGRLAAINRTDLEELLRGIVPSEIYASSPSEALKAQAIAARTEILSAIGHRHPATPYLLCATQHCQVYSGTSSYNIETDRAIKDTYGKVLLYEKRFVKAVYSSNCGGISEDNETVWGEHREPYLSVQIDADEKSEAYRRFKDGINEENLEEFLYTVDDTYCANSSFTNKKAYRWKVEIPYEELIRLLKKRFPIETLDDLMIEGRGRSGRIKGITIVSKGKKFYVDREYNIRQLFGGLKSGLVYIEKKKDSSGRLLGLIFTGGGWGHGVGMCQTGAIGMAERGKSFMEILMHYYHGTRVEKVY